MTEAKNIQFAELFLIEKYSKQNFAVNLTSGLNDCFAKSERIACDSLVFGATIFYE